MQIDFAYYVPLKPNIDQGILKVVCERLKWFCVFVFDFHQATKKKQGMNDNERGNRDRAYADVFGHTHTRKKNRMEGKKTDNKLLI